MRFSLKENRTRERWMGLRTGNSGISLVFREMWGRPLVALFQDQAEP
jgi:hypothetical protein